MAKIRNATAHDYAAIWNIFQAVVAPGDTYFFDPTIASYPRTGRRCDADRRRSVDADSGEVVGSARHERRHHRQ
jgi:hypothetical protein